MTLVKPPISQTLPDDPLKCTSGTLLVLNTKRRTVVVAEIKFGKVAVQVLLTAVLVDALHAARED